MSPELIYYSTVRFISLVILGCCILVSPVKAHHSAAMFDVENEQVLRGTVTKFQFTNPHVWIHLSVPGENGEVTVWKIEALNPNALKRKGWKRSSFKTGDEVSITIYPAKSGKPKGGFVRAVTADGTELGQSFADRDR